MSLSQQDEEILATLAAGLRAEDPELAEAMAVLRPPRPAPVPLPTPATAPVPLPTPAPDRAPAPARDLVDVSATLVVLVVVTTLRAAGLAASGAAAIACVLAVPWLVLVVWAAERSPGPGAPPFVAVLGRTLLSVSLIVVAVVTLPAVGQAVLAGVSVFVALPCFVLRLLRTVGRSTAHRPAH